LQILILRFDGNGSDDLHTVAVIDDPLHKIAKELALVIKGVNARTEARAAAQNCWMLALEPLYRRVEVNC